MSVAGSITQKSHYQTSTVSPLSTTSMPPTSTTVFQPKISSNLPDTIINFSNGNYSNNGNIINLQTSRNVSNNISMQPIHCSTTSTSTLFGSGKFKFKFSLYL